ncbi:MAG: hypothetical protein Kow0037_02080 [Calditrichia bacterium]
MNGIKDYYKQQIKDFLISIRTSDFHWPTFFVYTAGYLFFWYLTLFFPSNTFQQNYLYPVLFLFFWNRMLTWYGVKLKWPPEILLMVIFAMFLCTSLFIPEFFHTPEGLSFTFSGLLFTLFSGILVWSLGVLFRTHPSQKKTSFLPLIFLYIWFANFNHQEWPWLFYILQFILFFYLWNFTRWAERLSFRANWVYFFVLGSIAIALQIIFPWHFFSSGFSSSAITIYHFISRLTFLYLVALVAKFPFVIIYHHAHLTRKLKIATLFQTNVPQIIQFILLVLSFYFIIGNWQAHQLDKSIRDYFSAKANTFLIEKGILPESVVHFKKESYILSLENQNSPSPSNFYLVEPNVEATDSLRIFAIDSLALAGASRSLPLLSGQEIRVYHFHTSDWDSLLYSANIWGQRQRLGIFKVFPFSFLPKKGNIQWRIPLFSSSEDTAGIDINFHFFTLNEFTLGRIFLPVYDQTGRENGFLGMDITFSLNSVFFSTDLARQLLFWLVVYLIINFLIIRRVIRFGNQITTLIIQKFNVLKAGTRHMARGNLDYRIKMDGEDEFAELAEHFNSMGRKLKNNIEELRKKDRLEYELKIARDVQLNLLPKKLPAIPGYEVSAYIQTAMEVGGDFYDVIALDDERYLLMIGDVSGKGTSAAFYMAQCISLFRYATYSFKNLPDILENLNRYFSDTLIDRQVFVTAIIGLLDTSKHTLEYYRAGHTYPIWLPADNPSKPEELKSAGLGIGLDRTGNNFRKMLQPVFRSFKEGDALVLITDGVLEAAKQADEGTTTFLDEKKFRQTLKKCRGKKAQEVVETLHREIADFYGDHPPVDDYTILVLSRKHGPYSSEGA